MDIVYRDPSLNLIKKEKSHCTLIQCFGSTIQLSTEEYRAALMDPVAAFSTPVCSHMNGDHADDMKVSEPPIFFSFCAIQQI